MATLTSLATTERSEQTNMVVEVAVAADEPTATATLGNIDVQQPTSSPRIINADSHTAVPTTTPWPSPTATSTPTPTSTPSPPVPSAAVTLTPTPTSTPVPTIPSVTATPTPTATPEPKKEDDDRPVPTAFPPTFTPTAIPGDTPVDWSFSNTIHLYTTENEINFLSIWGKVFNNTGADQYLLTVAALVYDQEGTPIAGAYNTVDIVPVTTLVQGRDIPFQLEILLPEREFDPDQLTYELYVEAREAWYETREDMTILNHSWTVVDETYEINGVVQNRGPALMSFVKVIATFYDAAGNVVGVSWFHQTGPNYLAPGVIEFTIHAENLPFEATSYELQALGR